VNTTPHGRGVRKPALAALTVAAAAAPAIVPASAEAAPSIKLKTSHHVLAGHKVKLRGVLSGPGGQRVTVQTASGGGWHAAKRLTTGASGRFKTKLRVRRLGRMKVRVVGPGGAVSGVRKATVYRAVRASYYGPGLYGNRLACGGRLTRGKIGVANKTLPCGTRVRLHYHGRTVTAPVIDRGPYAAGRTYDLTEATKERLHFASTGTVWSSK